MKKLILIFIVTTLSLLYLWGAAAAYCKHENEQRTFHFGHHVHHHQAGNDDAKDQSTSKQLHSDCGICQFSVQAFILTTFPDDGPLGKNVHGTQSSPYYSSHIPAGPQKPNWLLFPGYNETGNRVR